MGEQAALTPEDVDRILTSAILQSADAQRLLWSALVDELLKANVIDHADLSVKISQLRDETTVNKGAVFDAITCAAMKDLTLREYPTLEDAPEWVRQMVRGEIVARKAEPGSPGSFIGAEGPSGSKG